MEENIKDKRSMNKKFLLQVLFFLIILVALICGILYYFVLGKAQTHYAYSTPSTAMNTQNVNLPTLINKEVIVPLQAENNSGESGKAILKQENGQFTITISLTNAPSTIPQPAHIHVGSCPGVGAIKYALNPVINGQSTTVLQVSLDQLKKQEPLALNVHKSKTDITMYTTCGMLKL